MWEDLTDLLPGVLYTIPGPPGATEDINLVAYSQILILFLCKSRATIDGILPPS